MSLQDILNNMGKMKLNVRERMDNRLRNAGGFLLDSVKANASLTDHTLEQLKAMGHPYSKRRMTNSGPHPDYMLHIQSGNVYDHIKSWEHRDLDITMVEVGIDEDECPEIRDIYNNETTRHRPLLEKTLDLSVNEIKMYLDGE